LNLSNGFGWGLVSNVLSYIHKNKNACFKT
jgi:hypothetical protein